MAYTWLTDFEKYFFCMNYNEHDVETGEKNIFRHTFSISEWYSLNYTNVIPLLNKLHRYFLLAHIFIFDFLIFAALVITYFVEGCKMILKRGKMNPQYKYWYQFILLWLVNRYNVARLNNIQHKVKFVLPVYYFPSPLYSWD